jgi:hypothetical protein
MKQCFTERLERRTLLSATFDGPESQLNTFTKNRQFEPGVAVDAGGNGVVVWTNDDNKSGSGAQSADSAHRRRHHITNGR